MDTMTFVVVVPQVITEENGEKTVVDPFHVTSHIRETLQLGNTRFEEVEGAHVKWIEDLELGREIADRVQVHISDESVEMVG